MSLEMQMPLSIDSSPAEEPVSSGFKSSTVQHLHARRVELGSWVRVVDMTTPG